MIVKGAIPLQIATKTLSFWEEPNIQVIRSLVEKFHAATKAGFLLILLWPHSILINVEEQRV